MEKEEFKIVQPSPQLAPYIKNYWLLKTVGPSTSLQRTVPTGMMRKQFNRIFSEYVGSNPKEFTRTIRFQRALHILEKQPPISLTALAYQCGYFDQSHLIKDFKALSGYTPTEYLVACPPHTDYFS